MQTYWLYFGERVLTAVRLPEGSSKNDVIRHALESEEVCPIGHHAGREAPFEFKNRLHLATVKTFEGS